MNLKRLFRRESEQPKQQPAAPDATKSDTRSEPRPEPPSDPFFREVARHMVAHPDEWIVNDLAQPTEIQRGPCIVQQQEWLYKTVNGFWANNRGDIESMQHAWEVCLKYHIDRYKSESLASLKQPLTDQNNSNDQ
jgi:hypothetical protein